MLCATPTVYGLRNPAENNESTYDKSSPALSMMNTNFSLNTRTVGVIIMPDVAEKTLKETKEKLEKQGLQPMFISDKIYHIGDMTLDATFDTVHAVLFDSLIVISGEQPLPAPAIENLEIAYKHKKSNWFRHRLSKYIRLAFIHKRGCRCY